MAHILLLNDLEKLTIKKDSTLMLALSMKKKGMDVHLLFEKDFFVQNRGEISYKTYNFEGSFKEKSFYIDSFGLTNSSNHNLSSSDVIHMRIDPPFDARYLRYLWMLKTLQTRGIKVVNSPEGVLLHNEKLYAYEHESASISYIGSSFFDFERFVKELSEGGVKAFIIKPLDLYQGIGIEKYTIDDKTINQLRSIFENKVKEYKGPLICQPFIEEVREGEIRALYFKGVELGSIIKTPKEGEFLANIASGASFSTYSLSEEQKKMCEQVCSDLLEFNVDFIAFDILGNSLSEVNVTCPGLLVEVSEAHQKNLANEIINNL